MKRAAEYILYCILFSVSLVVSNIVAIKFIDTGICVYGINIICSGAVLCYACTFLCTDIISEKFGKKYANMCVQFGFVAQIFASLLILLTQYLPTNDSNIQDAYTKLLGINSIFVISSLIAYCVSQWLDVLIFHKIRDYIIRKKNLQFTAKYKWIWNNLSTITSQAVDTIIFVGFAFGCGLGMLFDETLRPVFLSLLIGQYLIKVILALLDTPIFYLLTKGSRK